MSKKIVAKLISATEFEWGLIEDRISDITEIPDENFDLKRVVNTKEGVISLDFTKLKYLSQYKRMLLAILSLENIGIGFIKTDSGYGFVQTDKHNAVKFNESLDTHLAFRGERYDASNTDINNTSNTNISPKKTKLQKASISKKASTNQNKNSGMPKEEFNQLVTEQVIEDNTTDEVVVDSNS